MRFTSGNFASMAARFISWVPDFELCKKSDRAGELFRDCGTRLSSPMLQCFSCIVFGNPNLVSIGARPTVEIKLPL